MACRPKPNIFSSLSSCDNAPFASKTRASATLILPCIAARATRLCLHHSRLASRSAKSELKKQPTIFNDPQKPLDEAIKASKVNFVDAQSRLHPGQSLTSLLRQIDRQTQHLRQVSSDETGTPVVKIFSHAELREQEDIKTLLSKQKDGDATKKELEVSWAIDKENDLAYRLKKIEAWLASGRDVDVMIAPKRGGRRASRNECQDLIDELRAAAANVDGASEIKMDGSVGAQAVLHFKGVASDTDDTGSRREALRQHRNEKKAEKEKARADWRAELEARAHRRAERDRQAQRFSNSEGTNAMHN